MNQATNELAIFERHAMEMAVLQARQCRGGDVDPLVGAVAVQNGKIIGHAYRGEADPGDHAEFVLLEKKLKETPLAGSTVYTTLEPCTSRSHTKTPCADRLIERRVARVVVGMLDADQKITGRGILRLRQAGIRVDLFPPDLGAELEDLNRNFSKHRISLWTKADSSKSQGLYAWDTVPELSFAQLIATSTEVWVLARSAVNMLSRHNSDLRRFLSRGGRFHVMVSDTASPFCRLVYGNHEHLFDANLNLANLHLKTLSQYAPTQVQVRLLSTPPTQGIVLFRGSNLASTHNAVIQVQLYPEFAHTGSGRPMLAVLPTQEPWFNLFETEVLQRWESCK